MSNLHLRKEKNKSVVIIRYKIYYNALFLNSDAIEGYFFIHPKNKYEPKTIKNMSQLSFIKELSIQKRFNLKCQMLFRL